MTEISPKRIARLLGAALFGVSIWILTRELHQIGFASLRGSLGSVPRAAVVLASF